MAKIKLSQIVPFEGGDGEVDANVVSIYEDSLSSIDKAGVAAYLQSVNYTKPSNEIIIFKTVPGSPPSNYQAETIAYTDAALITDTTTKDAIDTFIVSLKNAGVYSKLKASYLLRNGSPEKNKWNIINPQNTDEAHRIIWNGAGTHSITGYKGGSGIYADTRFNQSIHGALNNESFGVYSRTNINQLSEDIGVTDSNNIGSTFVTRNGDVSYDQSQFGFTSTQTTNRIDSLGLIAISRTIEGEYIVQKNENVVTKSYTSSALVGFNFFIGARNKAGAATRNSTREYSYAFIGLGLTSTEMVAHYNAVQQLMTDLGISV